MNSLTEETKRLTRVDDQVCKKTRKVLAIQYFQHEWNEIHDCATGQCNLSEDTHPEGFVGLFSHATYSKASGLLLE